MLKRIQSQIFGFIKKSVKMTESITKTLQEAEDRGDKRSLDELGEEPPQKKNKQEVPQPMQGRVDRKRKVALLLAYCGKGYYGIQRNHGFNTIEEELQKALLACELIPQEHFDSPQKMSFQRAARTDKGVSAVSNIVSLKMLLNRDDLEKTINDKLPSQIRVIAHKRVTKAFNSKNQCGGRTYAYMTPTYAFAPFQKFVTEDFRTTSETISEVNRLLAIFKGTHNFHNFTSGIKFDDPSAKRYMISFECSDPFITDEMEFVIMRVKGQSFMLHHIRKMIGLVIAVMRGYCNEEVFAKAWLQDKLDIPRAPGVGLMLEELHYDGYNNRFGKDGMHEAIEWSKYKDVLENFKAEYIISHIVASEKEERIMLKWLGTLQFHKFDMKESDDKQWWFMRSKLSEMAKDKKLAIGIDEDNVSGITPAAGTTDDNTDGNKTDNNDGNSVDNKDGNSVDNKDGNTANDMDTNTKTECSLDNLANKDDSDSNNTSKRAADTS